MSEHTVLFFAALTETSLSSAQSVCSGSSIPGAREKMREDVRENGLASANRLTLPGPPQVYHSGQLLVFPSHKALALLLYLTVEEGRHARKTLID